MLEVDGYTTKEMVSQNNPFIIYKAIRTSDRKKVILKVCQDDQSNLIDLVTLQHEYQILKQLNLDGIIHVYDLIKTHNQLILVLEDIDGQYLKDYLSNKPVDLSTFFKIAIQLVDAIGELHLQHIIHKDINPNTIIINPKTIQVKLADFSVASQLLQETQEHTPLINLEGTLAYISPEQTGRMNRSIDYRSDFYSLGITFYEMLTGELPFITEDALEMVYHHLTSVSKAISTFNLKIPLIIEEIINKLLSKTPEGRYLSAAGLKADLIRCQLQWNENKKIDAFQLGQQDAQDNLIVSQKLYGREEQVGQLLATFDHVAHGRTELILVSGYSGIGKTSLIKEIIRPIVYQQGYFLSGKYDQLQRATPYSAIIEAFSEFIRLYLTESEERLADFKKALSTTLGSNGQVIIDIIPNIELIIGPQQPISVLPPAEAQNRLMFTFQNFVRVLAKPDHPLVLFLDDLQWIDSASLQLLNLLLTDKELHHFLMIGAYRDNEVSADHPLILMQHNLEKNGVALTNLIVTPLKQGDIERLIADSLISPPEKIPELAKLVLSKTHGNPFFINEFLKMIFHEKLLVFSYLEKYWQWNLAGISELPITDNVIDLLVSRIYRLPEKTQRLLELAACIGHTFDLITLSIINEQSLVDTASCLLEATKKTFVIPVNDSYRLLEGIANGIIESSQVSEKIKYRFIHDRIQQAAYQLIPEEKKQLVHLKIGRLLLKENPLTEKDEQLFEVLNHFNDSLANITDKDEQLKLAQYNLWAGRKAKGSSAYQAAKKYLEAGVELLKNIDASKSQDLQFSISKELATCQYLTGEFEKAEASFNHLLRSAKETLSIIEIYKLNCEMLSTLNRHEEAIQLGLKLLSTVAKIKIPTNPNLLHILWAIFKIKLQIGRSKIQDLTLPVMNSKQHRAIVELISQLYNSAFVTNQNLFVLFACINVRLSLRYGYTESTAFSCLVYAFTVMHGLNWYKEGLAFSELYEKLRNQYSQVNFEGKNFFVLGAFIDPWRWPLNKSFEILYKSNQSSYDIGDLVYSNYCNLLIIFHSNMCGETISETKHYLQNAISFIEKTKGKDFYLIVQFWRYTLSSLSENNFKTETLKQFEKDILLRKNNTEISFYYSMATKLCYLLGYFNLAIVLGDKHTHYAKYSLGLLSFLEGYFYYALAIAASSDKNKRLKMKKMRTIRGYFKRWSGWCPANFQHYLLLLDAEIARINNEVVEAIQLYTEAIKAAEIQNSLNIVALINECLGRFCIELSLPDAAKVYFMDAYTVYKKLGMLTKAEELVHHKTNGLNINGIPSSDLSVTSIDMLSLMKSAQAISGEIQLDKLLQKLLLILLQNAGAHRCLLLTKDNDAWYVEAEGTISEQRISLTHVEDIDSRTDLSLSLIRYVHRTEKPILVQTTQDFETFSGNDEYLSITQPQSVLVIPIFYQGQLKNILYLENRNISLAFKNEHVHILQILSTQAAISLQNARLYYQATHDNLTGLSNRNLLYQMFTLAMSKANRTNTCIAILLFDLDFFKIVNDTLGHQIGDKLLLYIAQQLKFCVREDDLTVRLGGDEFVVMIEFTDVKQVSDTAEKILQQIKKPIQIDGHEINITSSIGISIFPNDGNDISELLKQADMALYRIKAKGKNHFQFYTASLDHQIKQDYKQEIELRNALDNHELCVYYQPVFSALNHKPSHFEALMRWNHPVRGLIDAKHFIPIAERTALIIPLGKWVLRAALEQIKTWQEKGLKPIPIAVNISGMQFKMQTVSELVSEVLQETQVDPYYLELEFTESVSIEYTEKVLADIAELKSLGIKLTLDDFGTYYSSLSYLRQSVVDKLKIDQSFVKGIESDGSDKELIIAIVHLAHSLNLKVVAEGVETKEQMLFLENHDVDELQGYYLSHPLSGEACVDLLSGMQKAVEKIE